MARSLEKLETLVGCIKQEGGRAHAVAVDVSSREAVESAFRAVSEDIGPVECLVANAGVGAPTKLRTFDASTVQHIININLMGAVYCIEAGTSCHD